MTDPKDTPRLDGSEIAIVGMSCRLPGATTLEAFWRNLVDGVESLTELTAEDLRRSGLDPAVLDDPDYVARASVLDDVESFDGRFFGYTPLESKLMDPQHRLFLECAWEVLEQGGYNPYSYPRPVGVFTGAKTNTYLFSIVHDRELFRSLDSFQIALGNDLASMATRISYKLDLRGPSYALHTACSTSLVAVHLAVQSLLFGECDMAVAGGAAINVPQKKGYRYQKGGILSPDGRCRTFDADADGSNFGNGVGAVLLKRMDDALADGDHVYAMIRGSAANNDGAAKASYTAPGVEGQTSVLIEAMAAAGVDAETISYIEAHGTATDLGDSIEMLALDNAFKASTDKKSFCAIGSVKTNLGHLETAAGVAGLIKTALALENETLPPSLHFERPNPKIDFDDSAFYVQSELGQWPRGDSPRRAGVSSFGIGSTNAHVILEEAPPLPAGDPARPGQLLLLSAKTETALETMTKNLASRLAERREAGEAPELADVAFTLQVGRQSFGHRRALVARDLDDALELLEELPAERVFTHAPERTDRPVAFLLPGLGDHYVDMGRGLYETESVFREELDRCAELLEPVLGLDLREALFSDDSEASGNTSDGPGAKLDMRKMLGRGGSAAAGGPLSKTSVAHPALFAVEWALSRLLGSWGIRPKALIGYSLSEYVAAALAGVMELEDALELVAERAKLVDDLEPGAMLAVPLPEAELTDRLEEHGLSLAVVNGPALCVVSGPVDGVEALEAELAEDDVLTRRLQNERAFHSRMMEPAAERLAELARGMDLKAPEIPYVSNVTGTWITPEEATDPEYWARHLVHTVRFAAGVEILLEDDDRIYLEIGPGQNLASFVKQHPACGADAARSIFPTMRNAYGGEDDRALLLTTLGKLWLSGQSVDWQGFYGDERRLRVPLPTYPFERERHWVEPPSQVEGAGAAASPSGRRVTLDKQENLADWFYEPTWAEAPLEETTRSPGGGLVVFADETGLGDRLVESLRQQGHDVARVRMGEAFETAGAGEYAMPPADPVAYDRLVAEVGERRAMVHLWGVAPEPEDGESYEEAQSRGFYSLIHLAQALGKVGASEPVRLQVVTAGVQRLSGDERIVPERATVLGPARVIPQEFPGLTCGAVDVPLPPAGGYDEATAEELARALTAELTVPADPELVALRGGGRWEQGFEPRVLEPVGAEDGDGETLPGLLRQEGVYLLSGGLGGMGLEVAEHLARTASAKLVLTRRSSFPDRESWDDWLGVHGDDDQVSKKIHRLRRIEAAGGEVLALSADATSEEAMRGAVEATLERFGRLDGVFHLAGVPGGGILQLKTREAAEKILAPKVEGARVLDRVLKNVSEGEKPRFVLLFSSIASVLGEFGQADYCGANAFLDALAQSKSSNDDGEPRVLTVDWDIWRDVGLAVETEVPEHLKAWRAEMLEQAMSPAEGVEALDRILDAARPQTVVSAQDLPGRIELGKSFTGESFLEELAKAQGMPAAAAQGAAGTGSATAERRVLGTGFVAASGATERTIAGVWARVLGVDEVGVNDNFFDLGGNSLIGLQLVSEMSKELGVQIPPVTLFEHPSVAALTAHLSPDEAADGAVESLRTKVEARRRRLKEGLKEGAGTSEDDRSIAVVAMTGRFPGAGSVEELWDNLAAGRESIKFFTDEELDAAGIDPEVYRNPKYVRAGAVLEDIEWFDAGLFGYSPREAEVMDPQHRVFLECAWEALERAGTDPATYPGKIGVFAGSNLSTYLLQMHADPEVQASVNMLQAILGNDKDSLTTTVSYKLNLKGPSIAVQTFCSTSLVAVHMALQSLRSGECDMAMAGGIRIVTPVNQGYLFEEGGIAPSDGHSRSFDADADGSVLGNGVGIVVLKRLADAVEDGDPILAVLKGSAINNDGSLKAGYTAPSVTGQAEAVAAAYEDADVGPETISYLEAHGSATELGDPIEVTALTQAFRRFTDETVYCPIGSVKSNFGHLDRAAGVTGLIKTVLSLEHGKIPPTLHFQTPNPQIDFEHSPFYVATELADWTSENGPRRAGVNSLGMGGTNVHVVVEEPPAREAGSDSRDWQLLTLSARTQTALDAATENLAAHLQAHPERDLADVAFTLRTGRRDLEWRRAVVARDAEDARRVLAGEEPARRMSALAGDAEPQVVFLFPGLGGQYLGMARGLYDAEPTFRETVDRCAGILEEHLDVDLREVIWADDGDSADSADSEEAQEEMDLRKMLGRGGGDEVEESEAAQRLNRTRYTQPALFVVQYALATLWSSWGVKPEALVGYSLGEYVAAAVSGVLSLEDALTLVAERARRIDELEEGALLAVALPEDDLRPRLEDAEGELSLMAVNGPEQCVVSGPVDAVEAFGERLEADDVACRRLPAAHAFHSSMMEPLYDGIVELTETVTQNPPRIPVLSNLTGTWLTEEDATDATYWARHMCQPVRFSRAVEELLAEPGRILVEVGPGQTLASLVLQHPASAQLETPPAVVSSLRHSYESRADTAHLLSALGKLWLAGLEIDEESFWAGERRLKVLLPTYPFERQRYWIDARPPGASDRLDRGRELPSVDGTVRLYVPGFRRTAPRSAELEVAGSWLVFTDDVGVGDALADRLETAGARVTRVRAGDGMRPLDDGGYELDPVDVDGYARLLEAVDEAPAGIVHLWSVLPPDADALDDETLLDRGLRSLQALGRALGETERELPLWVAGARLQDVRGGEEPEPGAAALLGAVRALRRQVAGLDPVALDVDVPPGAGSNGGGPWLDRLVIQVAAEIAGGDAPLVAFRGAHRWVPTVDALPDPEGETGETDGFVLVTDASSDRGFAWARHLAGRSEGARLVLVESPGFPARDEWDEWLQGDDAGGLVSRRIRRLRELEELGAEIDVEGLDETDRDALGGFLERMEERHGTLTGFVHVAGLEGAEPELAAVHAWAEVLESRPPGFRLLVSPAAVPEAGAGPEDGAVGFALDAFAARRQTAGEAWTSVAWDLTGDDVDASSVAVARVLAAAGLPQVVVTPRVLPASWHRLEAVAADPASPATEGAAKVGFYARPSLQVDFVAPETETQEIIAQAWRELLGVDQVGIYDNFLDLGGDSLLATRLISRLRDVLDLDLPIRLVFEAATVAELAEVVEAKRAEEEEEDIAELMAMLDEMSDDEIEAELARKREALEQEV